MVSLSIFLLTGLSTSSFFLDEYLTKVITKNEHSKKQLEFALAQEHMSALKLTFNQAELYSEKWLTVAKKMAKTQGKVAFQLAIYYQDKAFPETKQAIFWYQQAIRLKYKKASISLAQYYFQNDEVTKAENILVTSPISLASNLDETALKAIVLKIQIAIHQGKVSEVEKLISNYEQHIKTITAGRFLLANIKKYQVKFSFNQILNSKSSTPSCDNSIQLFATNLKHLKYLESMLVDFEDHSINNSVCFAPVRYMSINALDCTNDPNSAIHCNELNWQPWAKEVSSRYVGLMLPKGGANVHLGILYFDAQDTVDVVVHEVSHLLGFIDEYPLVAEHVRCQRPQKGIFSYNISILKNSYQGNQQEIRASVLKQLAWSKYIKSSTPILQLVKEVRGKQYWQLGTPEEFKQEIGVFPAQTCDKSNNKLQESFSAFKGAVQRNKLQYFALPFPKLYETLLQENSTQYRMPSFYYNIALAHSQQMAIKQKYSEQAQYWIKQAESKESDIERRKKIRRGEF